MLRIGLISDTHGLLRPEAVQFLRVKPRIDDRQPARPMIVNPGSAGPRRFKLPVTAAELVISSPTSFSARIVDLLGAG